MQDQLLTALGSALTQGSLTDEALLVAKASTVSLVDVSLSTVMHEKLARFASASAPCRMVGSTALRSTRLS